ncbi:DUF1983 domain-containing protein [Cupriavidus necator]|uniref:phage tail tip fiber protein n=1 Tax=Cupriavidus necator TaxID=106590 RepID=UPI003ED1534A
MAGPKVPAIPINALDAIQDRNIYAVLRAIADMLNVRNGQTGDSDSAFVTRGELGNLRAGGNIVGVAGAQQSQGLTFPVIKPSDIARVINDLQAQVMESPLFKALGERVDRVDAPGTGVIAQIDEERVTRANAVAALTSLITTLEATVGDQSVALAEEAEVRANADGQIMGRYSVKIDANGYVSGFGLISTANNSTPYSDFIIRADRFAIGSPSGPGITPRIPFIVLTTPTVVNGYSVPAGVYIDAAMIGVAAVGEAQIDFAAIRRAHIQNAAVGTAQIEDLSVNTLKIQGEAVTIPRAANGGTMSGNSFWQTATSVYVPPGASAVLVSGVATVQNIGATGWGVDVRLTRDGTVLTGISSNIPGADLNTAIAVPLTWQDSYSGGGTYALEVNTTVNHTFAGTISCLGSRR